MTRRFAADRQITGNGLHTASSAVVTYAAGIFKQRQTACWHHVPVVCSGSVS
jgi:hypothetical protein